MKSWILVFVFEGAAYMSEPLSFQDCVDKAAYDKIQVSSCIKQSEIHNPIPIKTLPKKDTVVPDRKNKYREAKSQSRLL